MSADTLPQGYGPAVAGLLAWLEWRLFDRNVTVVRESSQHQVDFQI